MCVRRVVSTHQSPMSLVRWGFALHHCMADGLRCCDHNHKVSARIQIAVDGSVVQRWRGQTSRAPNKDKAGPGAHRPPCAAVTRGRGAPAKPPEGSAVIPEAALSASSPSRLTPRTGQPTPTHCFPRLRPPSSHLRPQCPLKTSPAQAPKPWPSDSPRVTPSAVKRSVVATLREAKRHGEGC